MPIQLRRLLLLFSVFIIIFIVIRHFLVPDSFGEFGHYRGDALDEIASQEVKFMGNQSCVACHDSIGTLLIEGYHDYLQCEVCHGPGYQHNVNPVTYHLLKPMERTDCAKCHSQNKARAEDGIIQQDIDNHHPERKCIECHNPHQP
ncbi:MAG: hypothetical protein ISR55_10040 [Bacteroidetes bacterium]|nr:hypothetical protein [Bacteroidota bacterium]